ncbi:ABC transporter substrate-binding protein [Sediminivirga luteola]|uniref:ABC transporter substrate-binding protein n=1 Tax=Sediminivirga luteola TaxID=1774748 RepID=UPI001F5ACA39|nr:ABC transporter substrate-binding protein [Sediminivirga luteola]
MRQRFPVTCVAGAATLALLLSACGGSADASGEADTDARLTIAYPAQPPNLDPAVSTASATVAMTINVWEPLVTRDSQDEIQPMLAESWEISDDGRTYTFHLREGVLFHDGTDMTSEDVVASLSRWSELSGPGQAYFSGATWSEVDDYTVQVELEQPSFGVLLALSGDREQTAPIMPAEIAEAAGSDPVTEIIGTGPFTFVEWEADRHLSLDRWDDYQPVEGEPDGRAGDRTAQVAGIDYEFVTDGATRVLGLQTGEYDVAMEIPYDNAPDVLEDESLVAGSYPVILLNLYYNKAEGMFADVEARRAVDTALERDSIMTAAVGEDFYTLTHSMMLDTQSGQWSSDVGADQFNQADPAAAEAMLEDLGLSGESVRIITTQDYGESYSAGVVIQEQLRNIGLDVSLDTYDWPTFTEVRDDPSAYDLAVIPNTAKDDPGTLVFFREDFAGFTDSPDELLAEYRASATLEEAAEHYDGLQEWFFDYLPVSKLGDADNIYGHSPDVSVDVVGSSIIWWTATVSD